MRKTIIALERDGLNTRSFSITLEFESDVTDIREAVRAACIEYCNTEEGRRIYYHNCCNFNWGDFAAYVPNEICKKHGFVQLESDIQEEDVSFDEQLVDVTDIIEDDEE